MSSIVVGLTPSELASLSLATIAQLQPSDIQAMTTDQVAAFTGAQLSALSLAAVHALSQADIQALNPSALKAATSTFIVSLKPSQMAELTSAELAAFSASELTALDKAQMAALSPAQIAALAPSAILGLGAGKMAALSGAQAGALTALQIIGMTKVERAALDATNVPSLSEAVINSLSPASLQQLTGFTAAEIAGFSPATIGKLSVAQFDSLIAPTIGALSTGKTARLTAAELQSLTTGEVASLTAAQVSALTDAQIVGLATSFLSELSASALTGFTAAQTAVMSPAQLAIVNAGAAAGNPILADAKAHEIGGSLSYAGALAVLQDAAKSAMSATAFNELTAVAKDLNGAGGIAAPAYVAQLFDDVVLGNSANELWNGGLNTPTGLGDLSAYSSTTDFNELIGKWFLGTDMPGTEMQVGDDSYASTYQAYTLPLYATGAPAMTDVAQGQLGDCWFLASVAETAMLDPSLIENMITTNGNGTYTVEFQVDGKADYVTVNNELPTYGAYSSQMDGSKMEFANSTTDLWAPLVEKALAQLSEQSGVTTGEEYAGLGNQYLALTAGGGEGITYLSGQFVADDNLVGLSSSAQTALLGQLQSSLSAGNDVLLGTGDDQVSTNLVSDHMFAVTSINASAGLVNLFNPWGANSSADGVAENFSVSISTLVDDQASFLVASGAKATA